LILNESSSLEIEQPEIEPIDRENEIDIDETCNITDSDGEQSQTIDESALTKEGFCVNMPENMPIGNSVIVLSTSAN